MILRSQEDELTVGRFHAQIANRAVEEHKRKSLLLQLVHRRLVHAVARGLEVATGNDLEGIANIDDQSTRLVRNIVPLLVAAPDLQAGDWHREQQSRQPKVSVSMHAEAF